MGQPGLRAAFPRDFLWACSASSYQGEGSLTEGGRGPSIWDEFCSRPGAIADASSGAYGTDSWRRWREDVALLRGLGVNAYRLSVAWPRIQASGRGPGLQAGLDGYRRTCEALLEAGIEPWITLYHWDLPLALGEQGGWTSRETAKRFADYSDIVSRSLGDLAGAWATLNEPWCSAFLGHGTGEHAPGHRNETEAYAAAHHLLLGHGLAMAVLRANVPGRKAGIVINPAKPRPANPGPEDDAASLRASIERTGLWLDPVHGRGYPEAHLAGKGIALPILAGDLEAIAAPVDFVGVNYYNEDIVKAVDPSPAHPEGYAYVEGRERRTEMGWAIVPAGLTRILGFITETWGPKALYVTENGGAFPDSRIEGGRALDLDRINYMESHIEACARALEAGVPLAGYFAWTLLDNFEWSWGFSRRFGLVAVDRVSGLRTPKASYAWYRDFLAGKRP